MNQKTTIHLSAPKLRALYHTSFPALYQCARGEQTDEAFLCLVKRMAQEKQTAHQESIKKASDEVLLMLSNEGKTIYELSREQHITIDTFKRLRLFLAADGSQEEIGAVDAFIDLYYLLTQIEGVYIPDLFVDRNCARRWKSGLDKSILAVRADNQARIIDLLVQKIAAATAVNTPYRFANDSTPQQQRQCVEQWWNEHKFHLAMAVKSPEELNRFLGKTLSAETMLLLQKAKKKGMPFFITPYYLSLLNTREDGYDDQAIRSYVLYSKALVETYGSIRAWEKEDVVREGHPNAAGWLLPNNHNIHRRYPEVAIMIPDSMGRACGGLCAVCQRMYDFQSKRLNFDLEALKPKESWDQKLKDLMGYFQDDTQLRDILITGGDALMSQNKTLKKILKAVLVMAARKREANTQRADGQKYAELQRVRLGSRLLAYLPMRVNDDLIEILRDFRLQGEQLGICQFVIQTHFQSPLEMTPQAQKAIKAILSAGWTITNQTVYTVAASRYGHTARLREVLNKEGVLCYYTFSVKGFEENYELFAPNSRSLQESRQEKVLGELTKQQQNQLFTLLGKGQNNASVIASFLKQQNLPFLATDRNVLNLPGIGKSMTFRLIGILPSGERIMEFEYDHSRKHSPVIHQIGKVYIVGNKSVAAYLRQLVEMGERLAPYQSIWSYRGGETERRFPLFDYPDYSFRVTDAITNLSSAER